jgi:3-methyladenine DNA glycosylase AlkC
VSTLLKDRYSHEYVQAVGQDIRVIHPPFDQVGFNQSVFSSDWPTLELKQRMRRISSRLHQFLPMSYRRQLKILAQVAPKFGGLEGMFLPDFVEQFGLEQVEDSLPALERFTQFSSSEFAIRPFLLRHPTRTLEQLVQWATHPSEHVRRLASEGCRPRLPWAMALPEFKRNPSPILPILEQLKADSSDYVRRSVANNLNDIAKDHPELVLELGKTWLGKHPQTDALIKHACRTLLKRGNAHAMALFGFDQCLDANVTKLQCTPRTMPLGSTLEFSFQVQLNGTTPATTRLEYAIDFVKANGSTRRKVFHLSQSSLAPKEIKSFDRKHRFTDFTTRKHYPGRHTLTILVNGIAKAKTHVELLRR